LKSLHPGKCCIVVLGIVLCFASHLGCYLKCSAMESGFAWWSDILALRIKDYAQAALGTREQALG
jgi:hypothetical protein